MKISNSYVLSDPISVPELAEQKRIATFLRAVDEKIAQLAQKKQLLLKYNRGAMQQIFDQKIRFKDENGGDFPNWDERELGSVAIFTSGGTPSKDRSDYWNGDIPWI